MKHGASNVAIIIVNWNGTDDTIRCLSSLKKLEKRNISLNIYVVDNGSNDTRIDTIVDQFQDVLLIKNENNEGFTGGNNRGIRQAMRDGAEYIWLLNNDTIVDPFALMALLDVFSDSSIGIASSKIYFMSGREFHHDRYRDSDRGNVLWYAGGIIDWDNVHGFHRGVDEVDQGQYDAICDIDFATGCSMMIRTSCLHEVGVFDERYFAYVEDMDFSFRMKQQGWRVVYAPKSIVWHKNAGSTDRPGNPFHEYYFTRNRLLFGYSYASARTKFALAKEAIRMMFFGSSQKKRAILDAICGRFGDRYVWRNA